jgi:carbon starvation protein CstA
LNALAANLAAGTALVAGTVMIHTVGLLLLARLTPHVARVLGFHSHDAGRTLVMTGSVLGIFLLHTIEVWLWAAVYVQLAATVSFGEALELSTATFSTLGYGGSAEVTPQWRLLSALEGINGFILIGWSTAYLVGAATRHGPFRANEHF